MVTNTGDLEFMKENADEEIRPCLMSDVGNAKVEHINADTR